MKRFIYDRSCYNQIAGQIGRLKTIFSPLPVTAGETVSVNMAGKLQLSRLKRDTVLDPKVDVFFFFVPHRHIFPDAWVQFMKEGRQTTVDWSNAAYVNDISNGGLLTDTPDYICCPNSTTLPKFYNYGYDMIFREYFVSRAAEDDYDTDWLFSEEGGSNSAIAGLVDRKYGRAACRLPMYWTTGAYGSNLTASTYEQVYSGTGTLDLIDIADVQADFKDATDKDWFERRYRDVMEKGFGSNGISAEQDRRPYVIYHHAGWMSGYQVNGTDAASIGQAVSIAETMVRVAMPPKYFNEHGFLWCMMLLRYPSILQEQKHYLTLHTWDYDNVSGDPDILSIKRPEALTSADFTGNGSVDYGTHPFGQHLRTHTNHVDDAFHVLEGYPFQDESNITSYPLTQYDKWTTTQGNDYFNDDETKGDYQFMMKAEIESRSPVPPATSSLYAGAQL